MAPRRRLLDLETHDAGVLFFYGGACHYGDRVVVAARAVVFLAAALLLRLVAPLRHAAAACAGLCGSCSASSSIDRAARPRSRSFASGAASRATPRRVMARRGGAGIECSK
ncbi:hypothetical protein PAHAL_1G280800 [Panicum hallii]|jgi:hypothetical protein|uniref:Uncharacterized protein n=1 Tax=Panicum hallii TaxID=206008 RepID=A0A2S3GQM8_9POAL|nr:hypothetical protein PAHAL_1G280800 [Panicum hallii]